MIKQWLVIRYKRTKTCAPLWHDKGCLSPQSRRLVNPVKGPSKTQISCYENSFLFKTKFLTFYFKMFFNGFAVCFMLLRGFCAGITLERKFWGNLIVAAIRCPIQQRFANPLSEVADSSAHWPKCPNWGNVSESLFSPYFEIEPIIWSKWNERQKISINAEID